MECGNPKTLKPEIKGLYRFGVLGFGVWGLGFRAEVLGMVFGIWGLGLRVQRLGFRVWGVGFEV